MSNLLNEIKNPTNEVESVSRKVEDMDITIKDAKMKQIDEILKECKGGFKFNKIVSEKTDWNNYSNWRDDVVEMFDKKGVYLTYYNEYTNRDSFGSKKINYELWLMQTGELEVYKVVEDNSNYQDDSNTLSRSYVSSNPLDYFDMEDIIEGIRDALERRMKSLNNRIKAQEERIKKLEKYI